MRKRHFSWDKLTQFCPPPHQGKAAMDKEMFLIVYVMNILPFVDTETSCVGNIDVEPGHLWSFVDGNVYFKDTHDLGRILTPNLTSDSQKLISLLDTTCRYNNQNYRRTYFHLDFIPNIFASSYKSKYENDYHPYYKLEVEKRFTDEDVADPQFRGSFFEWGSGAEYYEALVNGWTNFAVRIMEAFPEFYPQYHQINQRRK